MIPTLPDVAVGAILAALITAVVSLLGLMITKEQKVSDLRQAWIDALREDLAQIVACGSEIAFNPFQFNQTTEAQARITSIVQEANLRTYRAKLRLNLKEPQSRDLDAAIDKLLNLAQTTPHPAALEMEGAEKDLIAKAQIVLKMEWDRVREGELGFRRLRSWSIFFLFLLSALFFLALFAPKGTSGAKSTTSPACSVVVEASSRSTEGREISSCPAKGAPAS